MNQSINQSITIPSAEGWLGGWVFYYTDTRTKQNKNALLVNKSTKPPARGLTLTIHPFLRLRLLCNMKDLVLLSNVLLKSQSVKSHPSQWKEDNEEEEKKRSKRNAKQTLESRYVVMKRQKPFANPLVESQQSIPSSLYYA